MSHNISSSANYSNLNFEFYSTEISQRGLQRTPLKKSHAKLHLKITEVD